MNPAQVCALIYLYSKQAEHLDASKMCWAESGFVVSEVIKNLVPLILNVSRRDSMNTKYLEHILYLAVSGRDGEGFR